MGLLAFFFGFFVLHGLLDDPGHDFLLGLLDFVRLFFCLVCLIFAQAWTERGELETAGSLRGTEDLLLD